jgi:hypothetical protein
MTPSESDRTGAADGNGDAAGAVDRRTGMAGYPQFSPFGAHVCGRSSGAGVRAVRWQRNGRPPDIPRAH